GNVVADAGAVLDVSGTSGMLDLLPGETGQSLADLNSGASGTTSKPYAIRGKSTRVDSDGGTISLKGGQMLFSDATLRGEAGGSTATGGTLAVSSGVFLDPDTILSPKDPTLVLTQSGNVLPATFSSGIGIAGPVDSTGLRGGGRLAVDRFTEGGFSNLDLGGTVRFSGPVSIKASGRITAGTGPAMYADSTVSLEASRVVLGAPFQTPLQPGETPELYLDKAGNPIRMPASYGAGSLSVSAKLIDVGNLSLQGIGSANLVADHGDIRGNGTLAVAGDIHLTAGQIYPPTALKFTIAAFDYVSGGVSHAGSVTITGSGTRSLPLSAGGTLAIYGSNLVQNGVLRAPFGTIQLGWDGTGAAPTDILTGGGFSKTTSVTLGAKSITSASAIDPITGKGVTIPYGVSVNGTSWLDPSGVDITSGGLPQKSVTLSGESVTSEQGSKIDVRGGGDLLAYRFVAGNGGSEDILASNGSFAVIPGYSAEYAPYAPFSTTATSLGGDAGYVNGSLQVGQQIRLDGSSGLPAGIYTLLPARYALLPGAFLVTPKSGTAVGTVANADGSKIVSGYVFNGLQTGLTLPDTVTRFEVASAKVVNARAEYTQFLANKFLTTTGGFRLPGDSGQLVLSATRALTLQGDVLSASTGDFRGGLIDISSPGAILIANGSSTTAPAGTLVLDANLISGFGAESILIGGVRSADAAGTLVNITTGTVTLDNAGAALSGPEIILAGRDGVVLKDGSQIKQTGKSGGKADTLIIGKQLAAGATPTGSGNGALVRVNHGDTGSIIRRDVTPGGNVSLSVGSGASLTGDSILLDSTGQSSLGAGASLVADNLSLSSGRISLGLDPSVTPGADAGLVLSSSIIAELASASSLSLASYSSIDLLGSGVVGGTNAAGKPVINSLSLHAASIRGIGIGSGSAEFNASQIQIGGQAGAVAPAGPAENSGALSFRSDNLQLGSGNLQLAGFGQVNLAGAKEIRTVADGSLSTTGNLTLSSPLLTSGNAVQYAASSAGALKFIGTGSTGAISSAGLGSSLSLTGSSVELSSRIVLPSGSIIAEATSGDLTVSGSLEAGGVARRFKDQIRATSGGLIKLTADTGNVALTADGSLDVSAPSVAGNAGTIAVSAKNGTASMLGDISGKAGANGKGGKFALQVKSMPSLAVFDAMLNTASFTEARDYRVTTGDVAIDGIAHSHSYSVSADSGSITVSGTIDASGATGGDVRLVADRNLTLT
ncbi:MAG: hypothetical protein JWO82_2098, partial [Akkermansiaceae bacterium]|nr:hypothetical protein [Akkermansiaceae bacterium]